MMLPQPSDEPTDVVEFLNSIPGALERHRAGLEDIAAGRVITLDELQAPTGTALDCSHPRQD